MGEAMQRIGQAAIMGQLIAGILLGPSVFGAIWPEAQRAVFAASPQQKAMIDAVSQLGILMLLLLTGMETDLRLVKQARRAAISISAAGIVCALRLRVRARRAVARRNAAETRPADHHLAVSRYGVVDCFGEDRGNGRARDGFHAPKRRDGVDRLGHHRRHGRMGHRRDHLRSRGSRTGGRARLGSERARNGNLSCGELYARAASRVQHHPLDQRQFCQRSAGGHRNSRHHGHDGAHHVSDWRTYRAGCVRGRDSRRRVADPDPPHRRAIARPRRRPVHADLLFARRLARRLDHPARPDPVLFDHRPDFDREPRQVRRSVLRGRSWRPERTRIPGAWLRHERPRLDRGDCRVDRLVDGRAQPGSLHDDRRHGGGHHDGDAADLALGFVAAAAAFRRARPPRARSLRGDGVRHQYRAPACRRGRQCERQARVAPCRHACPIARNPDDCPSSGAARVGSRHQDNAGAKRRSGRKRRERNQRDGRDGGKGGQSATAGRGLARRVSRA